MKVREYIAKIIANGKAEDMEKLSDMLDEAILKLEIHDKECYEKYLIKLKELAYGKILDEETARKWVTNMQPVGQHWTLEEATSAMQNMNYNLDKLQFYVVANMIYNDYYNIVKDNEELALKLTKDWLDDTDAKENKLYEYWKYVIKR